jgi:heptosyltransferase-2
LTDIRKKYVKEINTLEKNSASKMLIHPFAAWKEKEWGLRNYLELIRKISKVYPVALIVPIKTLNLDVYQQIKNDGINIIETSSVEELINEIKNCSFFIGNDSGPINIANFLGKPTFTIFGSTNPVFTTTNADHQKYIQVLLRCSAQRDEKFCLIGAATYNCPGIQCMSSLTVEKVYSEIISFANKYCQKLVTYGS